MFCSATNPASPGQSRWGFELPSYLESLENVRARRTPLIRDVSGDIAIGEF